MTGSPADILAAARLNPVGPYLAPKDEWLKGWAGPAEWLDTFRDTDGRWVVSAYGAGGMANGAPAERLRLDTRRPEVRHLLCDLGVAPEWARKSAVACWCAGMGVEPADIEEMPDTRNTRRWSIGYDALRARCILAEKDGYYVPLADGGIGWWGHG